MAQKLYKLLLKDQERKDVKSTMFQYEKVIGMIETNRNQFGKAIDPGYVATLHAGGLQQFEK